MLVPRSHRGECSPVAKPARGGGAKNEILRMNLSIVENVRTSSGIVLVISRGLQLPYRKTCKKTLLLTDVFKIPYLTVDSVWGLLLVSFIKMQTGVCL